MLLDKDSIIYRGEGNSSLVIALKKEGKILRIPKYEKDRTEEFANTKKLLIDNVHLCKEIFLKLMDKRYVEIPSIVYLNQNDICLINAVVAQFRPTSRRSKILPSTGSFALLMTDYCAIELPLSLKSRIFPVGPVITIELKPKQGFIPNYGPQCCYYSIIQHSKLLESRIKRKSDYCPLDLFSGCRKRMQTALNHLFLNPQNNFRLFKDLSLVYADCFNEKIDLSSVLNGFSFKNFQDNETAKDFLIDLIITALITPSNDDSNDIKNSTNYNTAIKRNLQSSVKVCQLHHNCNNEFLLKEHSVLDSLLKVQMLDTIDTKVLVEEVIDYYNKCDKLKMNYDTVSITDLLEKNRIPDETYSHFIERKIWQYLLSLTAKDSSILISMQKILSNDDENNNSDGESSINFNNNNELNNFDSYDNLVAFYNESKLITTNTIENSDYRIIKFNEEMFISRIGIVDLDLKKEERIYKLTYFL